MRGRFPSQSGYKPGYGQDGVHLSELPVQVSSYYYLRTCILLDDVYSQVDYGICSFDDEAFLPRFQIHIQDVHLLPS